MRFHPVLPLLLACAALQPAGAGAQTAPAPAAKTAAAQATIVYRNTQYGFCFSLPDSWRGYRIVAEQWNGTILSSGQAVHGPQLLIRNPKWTAEKPYQDIPIMVFTPAEWQQVTAVTMSVSAAPIGPSELGHNSKYIFALPPRWIYFPDVKGIDEVQTLMNQNPFETPCGHKSTPPAANLP